MKETEHNAASAAAPDGASAATGVALSDAAAEGRLDPRAAAYLDKQGRLADLQSQSLIEQNAFELSHLRWRRFADQMGAGCT